MKMNISQLQHFSVGDGEGIRTTVFFKGCNLRCPWCHNPENLTFAPVTAHYKATGKTEIIGRECDAEDLLPELLEDKDFYLRSSGGVTLSGGEVMLQAEAAAHLARLLGENGVPVLIDTAGCVPYGEFEKLNPYVSGYLFDFKTADAEKYKSIGGCLETVSKNIAALLADGMNVYIRIPIIPDFNTDEADIRAIGEHLRSLGIKEAQLLPFHRLGSAKYEALGLSYAYRSYEPLSADTLEKIKMQYSEYFRASIEG